MMRLSLAWIAVVAMLVARPWQVLAQDASNLQAEKVAPRVSLALEIARQAAELDDVETSMNAVRRIVELGPPPKPIEFESNLLGIAPPAPSRVRSSVETLKLPDNTLPVGDLLRVIDLWLERNFDRSQVYETLKFMVLPPSRLDQVFLLVDLPDATELNRQAREAMTFDEPVLRRSVATLLMEQAIELKKTDELITELEKRRQAMQGGDAAGLLVYAYRITGQPELAEATVTACLNQKNLSDLDVEFLVSSALRPLDIAEVAESTNAKNSSQLATAIQVKLLHRALQQEAMRVTPWLMSKVREAIATDDERLAEELMLASEGAMDIRLNASTRSGQTDLTSQVQSRVMRECLGNRKSLWAYRLSRLYRNPETGMQSGDYRNLSTIDPYFVADLAAMPREQRYTLMKTSIIAKKNFRELLPFFEVTANDAPDFIRATGRSVTAELKGWPESPIYGLVDLALNDAEACGELDEMVDQLLEVYEASAVTQRAIAEWVLVRAYHRHVQLSITLRQKLDNICQQADFERWLMNSVPALAREIYAARRATNRLPSTLDSLEKLVATSALNARLTIEPFFVDKLPPQKFRHWIAGSTAFARGPIHTGQPGEAGWTIDPQGWLRNSSLPTQTLMCTIPLEGDFSIEFQRGTPSDSYPRVIHSGLMVGVNQVFREASHVAFASFSGNRSASKSIHLNSDIRSLAQWELRSQGGLHTLIIDGHPVLETRHPVEGFPFVGLFATSVTTKVSNLKITGQPTIPRQVEMLRPHLQGWTARRYGQVIAPEQRPTITAPGERATKQSVELSSLPPETWLMTADDLRVLEPSSDVTELPAGVSYFQLSDHYAHLSYGRPLVAGDRVSFEMFVSETQPTISVCLGSMSYKVVDQRIKLHWMLTESELSVDGIPLDHLVDDPQAVQLAPIKLAAKAWNQFALRMETDRSMVLNINGIDIYRRRLQDHESTEFGLVRHPRGSRDRVRKMVLEGTWPDTLPDSAQLVSAAELAGR